MSIASCGSDSHVDSRRVSSTGRAMIEWVCPRPTRHLLLTKADKRPAGIRARVAKKPKTRAATGREGSVVLSSCETGVRRSRGVWLAWIEAA